MAKGLGHYEELCLYLWLAAAAVFCLAVIGCDILLLGPLGESACPGGW